MQNLQRGGRNKKVASRRIGHLQIVLDDMVDLDFLDSLVNPQTMILVNDVIADLQVVEAVDRRAVVALFPLLLPARAEDIALREHNKALIRILEAATEVPPAHHHLSRQEDMRQRPVVK